MFQDDGFDSRWWDELQQLISTWSWCFIICDVPQLSFSPQAPPGPSLLFPQTPSWVSWSVCTNCVHLSTNYQTRLSSFTLLIPLTTSSHLLLFLFSLTGSHQFFWLPQNNANETPLHCAAQYGHTGVVRILLEELTDPTMRNNKFETPLDLAALYGRLEVVKLLLTAHPNLLSCNTKKHTPLHLASRNGHLPVVEVLLDAGMDINYEVGFLMLEP